MAFDYESTTVTNLSIRPPIVPASAGVVTESAGIAAVDVSMVASDIVGLCFLPAGCVPVDFLARADQLSSASASQTLTLTFGIAKAAKSDLVSSTSLIITTSIAQAGTAIARMASAVGLTNIKAKIVDRIIAAKVAVGAVTGSSSSTSAAAGNIEGRLQYKVVDSPDQWSSSLT